MNFFSLPSSLHEFFFSWHFPLHGFFFGFSPPPLPPPSLFWWSVPNLTRLTIVAGQNSNFTRFYNTKKKHRKAIKKRNLEISWNFFKKSINHAWTKDWTLSICRQICYSLDVSGKISPLIRFANYPYTFYNQVNKETIKVYLLLATRQLTWGFSKRHENMWIGVKRNAELFL